MAGRGISAHPHTTIVFAMIGIGQIFSVK